MMKLIFKYVLFFLILFLVVFVPFTVIQLFGGHMIKSMGLGQFLWIGFSVWFKAVCAIICAFLFWYLCLLIGNLIGGFASGYRLLLFDDLGFRVEKRGGRLKFTRSKNAVGMVFGLPSRDDAKLHYWPICLSSYLLLLLLIIVSLICVDFSDCFGFVNMFLLLFSFFCSITLVRALLSITNPAKHANFFTLSLGFALRKDKALKQRYKNLLQVNTYLLQGKELADIPDEFFTDEPLNFLSTPIDVRCRNQYISRLISQGQYEQANQAIERDQGHDNNRYVSYLYDVSRLTAEFMTQCREDVIGTICTDRFLLFLSQQRQYALLYAYNLLYVGDEKAAKEQLTLWDESGQSGIKFDEKIDRMLIARVDERFANGEYVARGKETSPQKATTTWKDYLILFCLLAVLGTGVASIVNRALESKYVFLAADEAYVDEQLKALEQDLDAIRWSSDTVLLHNALKRIELIEDKLDEYGVDAEKMLYEIKLRCQERLDSLKMVQDDFDATEIDDETWSEP